MNPILELLHDKTGNPTSNPSDVGSVKPPATPSNLLADFARFKKQMEGKDPKAMVDELRASGRMSDAQYHQLLQRAKALQSFLK